MCGHPQAASRQKSNAAGLEEYLFKVSKYPISFISSKDTIDIGIEQKYRTGKRTFFVLDLRLDIVDGIAALDLESDGFPG